MFSVGYSWEKEYGTHAECQLIIPGKHMAAKEQALLPELEMLRALSKLERVAAWRLRVVCVDVAFMVSEFMSS